MATATVRDLRTRFPAIRKVVAREGEVIVTERGHPAYVLRPYVEKRPKKAARIDYFKRLKARQPRALTARASHALDELNRGER